MAALRAGATPEELKEAIWVAAEMRAGGAYAHSTLMLATMAKEEEKRKDRPAQRSGSPGKPLAQKLLCVVRGS
jgi:hypothetical protein